MAKRISKLAGHQKRKDHTPVHHAPLTDFYTAHQKRQMESEKLEAEMFEQLKKLRKNPR